MQLLKQNYLIIQRYIGKIFSFYLQQFLHKSIYLKATQTLIYLKFEIEICLFIECYYQLINELKKSNSGKHFIALLPTYLNIKEETKYIAKQQKDNIQVLKTYTSKNKLKASDSDLYQQIIEKVKYSKKELDPIEYEQILELLEQIQPKYEIGDNIKKVSGIELVIRQNDNMIIMPGQEQLEIQNDIQLQQDNIVLENSGPIDELIVQYQKRNEWHDKVKLVAISLKASSEEIIQLVTKKKWECMNHYKLIKNKNGNHQFLDMLNIEGLPIAIIIGKNGQIVHLGYHFEADLDKLITIEMSKEDVDGSILGESSLQANLKLEDQKQNGEGKIQQSQNVNNMIKEEVKVLKQYLQIIHGALQKFTFQFKFQIKLRRCRIQQADGSYMISEISQLQLKYKITEKEMETVDYFMELVWNQIPEHLRIVLKSEVVCQSKFIQNIIQMAFARQGVKITYKPTMRKSINWDSNLQKILINDTEILKAVSSQLNLEKFYDGLEESKPNIDFYSKRFDLGEEINEIVEELRSQVTLGPGRRFAPILNYKKFNSQEIENIFHSKGQDSIAQLRNIDKLIEKNSQSWSKIVKFVALNIGDEKEFVEFLEQYQDLQGRLLILYKKRALLTDTSLYAVKEVPYFIVIDKSGFIKYINSPMNLERSIQQLVNENENDKNWKPVKIPIKEQSVNQIKQILLKDDFKEYLLSIDKQKVIQLKLDFEVQKIGNDIFFDNIYLNYFIRDKQEEDFNKLLDRIFSIIPEDCWIIKKQIQQTISIPYPGDKCAVCQKDISKVHQQYYCYFKNEHVCQECAEFTDVEKQGMDMYKYQDTLIFINGPLQDKSVLHDIDLHKIGKNRKLFEGQKPSQKHSFECNGCSINYEGPRYIAVNARPGNYRKDGYVDYCKNCFLILKNKESIDAKKIIESNSDEGMTADIIFTRVLFNYGNYREF
ncbi:unnamed protein product (macronuclear) [Paramecium tetraurelia]|uniref:Uncharacterized protein n=1 Tax=Paramecium tetraurelia TaxID=5888 RepID=A0C038_PARTE|nr:uncharacterized protein GSPATT00006008001 [Paramecium tetraurelia]CAK64155.1 unnamed protein product [Paramecium tetraurelia]|eukprot:XP_001431553.1 hypothetical protein (macronuclear) [Paramecium tetraurelia strain d4-2]